MPNRRILYVDDDENMRDLITTMLGFSALEVLSVPDPAEALRMMERERFSLYIIDGQLVGESGLTLCQQIREVDQITPVVIFSGHGYQSDIDAGTLAGANAYVVKPDSSELIATAKRLLEGAHDAAR
jgi:two-component system phosphate regulon response regulator OmpR